MSCLGGGHLTAEGYARMGAKELVDEAPDYEAQELAALKAVTAALLDVAHEQRARVIRYAWSRFGDGTVLNP